MKANSFVILKGDTNILELCYVVQKTRKKEQMIYLNLENEFTA